MTLTRLFEVPTVSHHHGGAGGGGHGDGHSGTDAPHGASGGGGGGAKSCCGDHCCTIADPDQVTAVVEVMADSLILLNCFYLALYILQTSWAVAWTSWPFWLRAMAHMALIMPVVINISFIGPAILKASSVLHAIRHVDADVVREVFTVMERTQVHNLRLLPCRC